MDAPTSTLQRMQLALQRMTEVFTARPARAQGSGTMHARIVDGYRCEAREGGFAFTLDMPAEFGGTGAGPTPGVLGRGALASCLAIGVAQQLAAEGVAARSIDVDVEADFDTRGLLGFDGVPPGYTGVRYTIHVDCDLPADRLAAVVARVERSSPYLHIFRDAQPVTGRLVAGPRG